TRIAGPLGLDVVDAAAAIVDVVNAGMAAALRIVSVERGYDPREFALVAFGGGGPVHAARLAQELEIRRVVVPPIPGASSALGRLLRAGAGGERHPARLRAHLLHPAVGGTRRRHRPRLRGHGRRGAAHAGPRRRAARAAGDRSRRRSALPPAGLRADGTRRRW